MHKGCTVKNSEDFYSHAMHPEVQYYTVPCYTREGAGCARYRKRALHARLQHRRLLPLASRHLPDGSLPPSDRPLQGAVVSVSQLQLRVGATGPQSGFDVFRKFAKLEYKGAKWRTDRRDTLANCSN